MSERDMLLRAILTEPGDDTARLVFADYLDEHGEPERAEFIRLQVALSANPPHKRLPYPAEPTPLRAMGDRHYQFGAYASGEVDVYARLDGKSGPWEGAEVKAREQTVLNRLCHFSKVLRGWSVHGDQFHRTLGVGAPAGRRPGNGYHVSVALFDAPDAGRACLNFSFSRGNVKVTGDMRLYFDRGFACEWWCPLLDFREHAAFMFANYPVTAVRFTEREPVRYENELEPDLWRTLPCEWSDFTCHGQLPGWLPREVCPIGDFSSLAAATEAVSRKAVAYGRALAGLPPLPTRTTGAA